MGSNKGSADPSGMYAAMASEQAAQLAYSLGEQQLQWAQQVWNAEQPLVTQAEQTQIALGQQEISASQQAQAWAQEQQNIYNQYYLPLEQQYTQAVQNWASPENIATVTGQAQSNVAEEVNQGIDTAKQQLESYGINPESGRYRGLEIAARTMGGAAQAGAGTTAAQNLKYQQLGLEGQAAQIGQGLVTQSGQLVNVGTGAAQAGSGATTASTNTAQQNLATGSQAFTAPTSWFNTGAANMGVYTNAVANYNNTNLGYAQLGAQSMMGLGQLGGTLLGTMFPFGIAKGGPVQKFQDGGPTGGPTMGIPPPSNTLPSNATTGGYVGAHMSPTGGAATDDVVAQVNKGEFVMPRDVTEWKGQEYFVKEIDKARQAQQQFSQRDDIGGEPTQGIPNRPPSFVSRPLQTGRASVPNMKPPSVASAPIQRGIPTIGS